MQIKSELIKYTVILEMQQNEESRIAWKEKQDNIPWFYF